MSEWNPNRKEMEWQDAVPDEEEEAPDPGEDTYRDGSSKNECWKEEE